MLIHSNQHHFGTCVCNEVILQKYNIIIILRKRLIYVGNILPRLKQWSYLSFGASLTQGAGQPHDSSLGNFQILTDHR